MRITLISHASLLVETNGIRLLTDPWYSGEIYLKAWELCPPPPTLPDFQAIDALFISHAHPDHYHLPTLESIKAVRGGNLPIFIAKFFHANIARDLRRMGFTRVTEMRPGHEFSPFPGVHFFSQQYRMDDSLLVVRGERDETLININDTPLRGATLVDLHRRYPRPDYCAAQFAIAQGYPYCYDNIVPDFNRDDLVRRFDSFASILAPRHMIPFASFVRFCNHDNAHMNRHKMTLNELVRVSTSKLTVLYPGDSIDRGRVDHLPAHRQYFDAAQKSERVALQRDIVTVDTLNRQLEEFAKRLKKRVPRAIHRKLPRFAFICTDQPWGFVIDGDRVVRMPAEQLRDEAIQYRLASEVLSEAVQHDWGWADLSIGARFRARVAPGHESEEIWFWVIPMLAGEGYLTLRTLWFLRPRSMQIWWGRRKEVIDYLANALRGKFLSQVVRKKTATLG